MGDHHRPSRGRGEIKAWKERLTNRPIFRRRGPTWSPGAGVIGERTKAKGQGFGRQGAARFVSHMTQRGLAALKKYHRGSMRRDSRLWRVAFEERVLRRLEGEKDQAA